MILLTGATGFLGSKLARKLLEYDYDVACTYRELSEFSRVEDIYDSVEWVKNTENELIKFFEKNNIDAIIHCATSYGRSGALMGPVIESNIEFPLLLFNLAIKFDVNFFVNTDTFFEDELASGWIPGRKVYLNNYVKSKFFFKEIILDNIEDYNIAFINMKLQHIYGPGDSKNKFVSYITQSLKENVDYIELSAGIQKRDWTYVDDVVDAYMCIINKLYNFETGKSYCFDVGTGKEMSLKEFCITMKNAAGADTELLFGVKEMNQNELMHSMADISMLKKMGWIPKVSIEEGIRRLLSE